MSNNSQLADVRMAISSVSQGKVVKEDAWMSMWCNTNWGDLLQPAPLSIALLGSILIIASSTDDFSLVTDAPPGLPPFNWQYAKHPDSFKTCLQQMVGDGYDAYEAAHQNMESIQNNADQVPGTIHDILKTINNLDGTAQDISDHLPNSIDDLVQLSKKCSSAAKDTEDKFKALAGLAQEMVLACTYKAGKDEQAFNQNDITLAVLAVQKEQEDKSVKEAKEMTDFLKKSYTKAEDAFYQAVKDVPSGWDLVGMQTVQSLTGLVVSAGNAYISQVTLRAQAASAGIGAFRHLDGEDDDKDKAIDAAKTIPTVKPSSKIGVSTQPNTPALTDSGTLLVQQVLDQVNNIKVLLVGADGKPDWDKIRTKKDTDKTGATYVQGSLESLKSQLEIGKPISDQLAPIIDEAHNIVTKIIKVGGDISAGENPFADQVKLVENLIRQLNALLASVNLVLQQPGTVANGPATPATPANSGNTSAAQLAVQNAKYMVDQTKSQLEASRDSYEKAADRLVDQQKEITKTIAKMTELKLTNVTLQQLLPILKRAVGAFTTLRAQLSQLVQFFDSVASLLIDVMAPSVERWVKTLEVAEQHVTKPTVGGVAISAFTRDLIYRQMMMPLKVSTLAVQISRVYMEISDKYIMPAQRQVGTMLRFDDGDPHFKTQLERAQKKLAETTTDTSDQISDIVSKDQKEFLKKINGRLETIMQAVAPVLPEVDAPLPPLVKDVKDSHTSDFNKLKKKEAAQNPMFNPDDAM